MKAHAFEGHETGMSSTRLHPPLLTLLPLDSLLDKGVEKAPGVSPGGESRGLSRALSAAWRIANTLTARRVCRLLPPFPPCPLYLRGGVFGSALGSDRCAARVVCILLLKKHNHEVKGAQVCAAVANEGRRRPASELASLPLSCSWPRTNDDSGRTMSVQPRAGNWYRFDRLVEHCSAWRCQNRPALARRAATRWWAALWLVTLWSAIDVLLCPRSVALIVALCIFSPGR
jgi:hypothetical protein